MKLLFEELQLKDLDELKKLYYLCFNIDTDINKMKDSYLNLNNSSRSFVLKIDNKIIGHIKYDIINNIFGSSKPYMYMSDVCIHPDYRENGYSKLLIQKVEEVAKKYNCSYIFLNSSKKRKVAHKLYKHLNYQKRDSIIFKKNI